MGDLGGKCSLCDTAGWSFLRGLIVVDVLLMLCVVD